MEERSRGGGAVGAGEAHREEVFLFLKVRNGKKKVASSERGKQQVGIFLIREWIRNAIELLIHSPCVYLSIQASRYTSTKIYILKADHVLGSLLDTKK